MVRQLCLIFCKVSQHVEHCCVEINTFTNVKSNLCCDSRKLNMFKCFVFMSNIKRCSHKVLTYSTQCNGDRIKKPDNL